MVWWGTQLAHFGYGGWHPGIGDQFNRAERWGIETFGLGSRWVWVKEGVSGLVGPVFNLLPPVFSCMISRCPPSPR